jgi:hypothetical protein
VCALLHLLALRMVSWNSILVDVWMELLFLPLLIFISLLNWLMQVLYNRH